MTEPEPDHGMVAPNMLARINFLLAPALAVCLVGSAAGAAEKVSMWVDENGVTHFSNRQFAPQHAEEVTIEATNSMDVPERPPGGSASKSSDGPSWSKIELPDKKNPKGRRPMHESLYTGRRHQDNRRHHR